MKWDAEVVRLRDQLRLWMPPGVSEIPPDPGHPLHPALAVEKDGRRLYLELAPASEEEKQAVVEWWSSRGVRVRLLGPDENGAWQVFTTDYVPMRYDWNAQDIGALASELFAA